MPNILVTIFHEKDIHTMEHMKDRYSYYGTHERQVSFLVTPMLHPIHSSIHHLLLERLVQDLAINNSQFIHQPIICWKD